jgi:hypothetical protein
LGDDGFASGTNRRFYLVHGFLTDSVEFVGAIGLRKRQKVFFHLGFIYQVIHFVLCGLSGKVPHSAPSV